MKKLLRILAVLCATALFAAGCGNDDDDAGGEAAVDADSDGTVADDPDPADDCAASEEPITVGVINSITGPGATAGVPAQNVWDALLEQTNDDGGIDGRPIELVVFDDKTDPTESTRGFAELTDAGAVTILGPLTGTAVLATGPLAAQQEIPLVVFAGTQTITDPSPFHDWIFRAAPADLEYWRAAVAQIQEEGDIERIAIMQEETAYGDNAVDTVEEELEGSGIEIVETVTAPADAVDVTAQARRIADSDPDAVIMGISIGSLATSFVKARAQIGLEAPLYANPSVTSGAFLDAVGADAEGLIATAYANLDDPSPRVQDGVMALAEEYGFDNTGFAEPLAGNSWATLVAALENMDCEITGPLMQAELENLCGIVGFLESEGCFTPDDHDGWKADSVIPVRITADGTLENL